MRNARKLNQKANRCKVKARASQPGIFDVKSPSGSSYVVDLNRVACTCPSKYSGCSHEMAARKAALEMAEGRKASFLPGDASEVARSQHKVARPICDGIAMVLRDKVEAPKPEPAPKSPRRVKVAFLWGRMTAPEQEDEWMVEVPTIEQADGTWRKSGLSLSSMLELNGWTATAPRMVRGNERPGLHRYEFEMVEVR
jgi:hypothetical protein